MAATMAEHEPVDDVKEVGGRTLDMVLAQNRLRQPAPLKAEARPAPSVRLEEVTGETAWKWLGANLHNRDMRRTRVVGHVRTLNQGDWKLTTDGIGFDTVGRLINGQHRLMAIAFSGVPATVAVFRGLEPEAQDVMDQNLPRKTADALKLRGEKDYNNLAAALNWLFRLDYIADHGGTTVHFADAGERPTTPQLLRILDANPGLPELVSRTRRVRRDVWVRHGLFAALWQRLREVDAADADVFVERLAAGDELKATDAIFVLRRTLSQEHSKSWDKMPDFREAAIVFKAWNAYREGKPLQNLTYKYGGRVREPFPFPR